MKRHEEPGPLEILFAGMRVQSLVRGDECVKQGRSQSDVKRALKSKPALQITIIAVKDDIPALQDFVGREWDVTAGELHSAEGYWIGSAAYADLSVPDDIRLSKKHCKLHFHPKYGYILSDDHDPEAFAIARKSSTDIHSTSAVWIKLQPGDLNEPVFCVRYLIDNPVLYQGCVVHW